MARPPIRWTPPGNRLQGFQRRQRRFGVRSQSEGEGEGREGVFRLEATDQGKGHCPGATLHSEFQALSVRRRAGAFQTDVVAAGAVGDDAVAALPAGGQDGVRVARVRVHHPHPAVGQDVGEQAHLALQIVFHGPVVVQVIAAEIGERRRRHLHPVQAVLGEAVAGGFHGQELDAVIRQPA